MLGRVRRSDAMDNASTAVSRIWIDLQVSSLSLSTIHQAKEFAAHFEI